MALRNIVQEGDAILNKVCRPVTKFDDRLATLLDDMQDTLTEAGGLGLAGPQVGMMRRLFICEDLRVDTEDWDARGKDFKPTYVEFINPEFLERSEDDLESSYEGCLSFPGYQALVKRPHRVKVRAQDRHGEFFEIEVEALFARCIQHENDHIDGVTILESADKLYKETRDGLEEVRK